MINFASLFGNFNRGGNSAISEVLEKPDATLEQLLDVETFPNEYKSNNPKVLEFLKYDKYRNLIKYVTQEGPADDQKKGYKFPMVAADVLSSQNSMLCQMILPDEQLQVNVQYDSTQQYDVQVDDNDEQYLQDQKEGSKQEDKQQDTEGAKKEGTEEQAQKSQQDSNSQQNENKAQQAKPRKTKIIKESRVVKKTRKQDKQPLIHQLFKYFQGPVNYTLAGYVCKVMTSVFTKKPLKFYQFLFEQGKNRVALLCNHIESRSVGDFVFKLLVQQTTDQTQQRKGLYDHLIHKLSEVQEAHVISNLSYTLNEIIQKSATYIKTKPNVSNGKQIVNTFLDIFYRTEVIHQLVTQCLAQSDATSGYSCLVLHSYLHHTEIETFNSFKLEKVLEQFIEKSIDRLRNTPKQKRTLGMGRVKIVQIFCFLVRKPKKNIGEQENPSGDKASSQLLQELYIHQLIAKYKDFFAIILRLLQSFQNNNILHNQVFKIIQSVIVEPEQNKSALQALLLDDECTLLKFIVEEEAKDSQIRKKGKTSCRKGYIGHTINICKLISKTENNSLLNSRIKQNPQFKKVLNTMVAADITETNKNLAGYQMKKNASHQVMFQKEDIIAAYTDFLSNCPKPEFENEREASEQQNNDSLQEGGSVQEGNAQQMIIQQERDEEKFNQVAAVAEQISENNPKFWMNHISYDIQSLMNDIQD